MAPRPLISSRARAVFAFVVLVAALVAVSHAGALMLSPALALVAVIGLGLFTGERPIAWVRRAVRARRRRTSPPHASTPSRARQRIFAVGVDLAFALAMRPPPQRALAS